MPIAGTIVSFDVTDQMGLVELADGRVVKFGRTACKDLERALPTAGMRVAVDDIEPGFRGALRAKSVVVEGVYVQASASGFSPDVGAQLQDGFGLIATTALFDLGPGNSLTHDVDASVGDCYALVRLNTERSRKAIGGGA